MPQQTNLNVSPYFDDFDPKNDYHRILFKPGYPVQARELTGLQSILQNQIEKFGQHFFKEGAKVIPGNTAYSQLFNCVQLNNNFQGVPVAAYVEQLVGAKITGQVSGVTAVVDKVVLASESERNNLTLYISYIGASTTNNATTVFGDGEELSSDAILTSGLLGNTAIAAGSPFAITLPSSSTATGSAFMIQEGVYFIRGQFVNVESETLLLDQYDNKPNYRVGLYVDEEIITPDLDESLNDNSQGFNNYAAPGADRLKVSASLFKKGLDDFDDDNFIELGTIKDGVLRTKLPKSDYSVFGDELARRTYDESGDYYVAPFDVSVENSLDDNMGNNGVFQEGQFTYSGSTPSDGLGLYKIGPGKAYVRGYELETTKPTFLDSAKPRTSKTIQDQQIIYNTGPSLTLNRAYGGPIVGVGNTYILSLRDQRVGTDQRVIPGNEIGVARVYDSRLESGSYNATNANLNEWVVSLYDVQTITDVTVNQNITAPFPCHITGSSSGATGFLFASVSNSSSIKIYETEGEFIKNEELVFSGDNAGTTTKGDQRRVATALTAHTLGDVKSVFGSTDNANYSLTVGLSTFTADVVASSSINVGFATVSPCTAAAGISTITAASEKFLDQVKKGDLLQFSDPQRSPDLTMARITSIGSSAVEVIGVTTVTGIANGKLPVGVAQTYSLSVSDLKILSSPLADSSDNTLYTVLPKSNISDVDLTDASITIRRSYDVTIASNTFSSAVSAGSSESFLGFDEERYSLILGDGSIEPLSADQFVFGAGGTLNVVNLSTAANTGARFVATLKRLKPKAKQKIRNRVNSIIINKSNNASSGIGTTTLNDGLTYGDYPWGTRVQDSTISVNTPDLIKIHGIFESDGTGDPSASTLILSSITTSSTTTLEFIIGEEIVGQTSDAIAIIAEVISDTKIAVLYKNQTAFVEGEIVKTKESKAQGAVVTVNSPSFDISNNFTYKTGQDGTFYDQGRITRKKDVDAPSRKIKVYFMNGYYEATDDGDITTIDSYKNFNYATEIKTVDGVSNADIIDIRPRVSTIDVVGQGSRSPLEFYGRTFDQAGNSAQNILASDEAIQTTYSFYLPRIDRIFLTKDGKFQVNYGTPAEKPEKPGSVDDALEIATITLPPYLYDVEQASIDFMEHKRFRMVDIKQLEKRIKNLEYYTTLSLLETNTANLFVPDSDGLNRFKSGFFVDNFTTFLPQESEIKINNSIDTRRKEARPRHYTNSVDLIFGPVVNVDATEDDSTKTIEGINIKRNNDVVTLDYSEVEWLKQNFATRSESVTPFMVSFWQGTLELTPSSDVWTDTVRLKAKTIETEGNYAQTMADAVRNEGVDPQTGLGPIKWDSWETNWTGTEVRTSTATRSESSSRREGRGGWINGGTGVAQWIDVVTTVTTEDKFEETIQHGTAKRNGLRTMISEQFDRHSVGDRTISKDLIPHMRNRNVLFEGKRMKPLAQLYAFFDGKDITKFCVPKLLEITMTKGTFQVGETVGGLASQISTAEDITNSTPTITFRVAQSNHKEGAYDNPKDTFKQSPYSNAVLQATYSSTSTVLNVDCVSLAEQAQGDYYGWVEKGMKLRGKTSGAEATINDVRLIADFAANCYGSYYIPNPNVQQFPRFEVGKKTFTLIDSKDNDQDNCDTIAEEAYEAKGTLETVQENIISVRNSRTEQRQEFQEKHVNRSLGIENVGSREIGRSEEERFVGWYDPLAQSFLVEDPTGIFLTRCDVYFRSKDDNDVPLVFQLRTMKDGYPTTHILPFSEIIVNPDDITISNDGSIATSIEFKAPVYLEGETEYAICLASNSTKYSVYISRVGENDLLTDTFISNQPYLGSLFKSQNASTWSASQWEDLKFVLYRANFLETGSVQMYSPKLSEGNAQIPQLMPNSLALTSRKVRVGLGTTVADGGLTMGNTVYQITGAYENATGDLVGTASSITVSGGLSITNAGTGYASGTHNGTNLVTLTGNGTGATANVVVTSGAVTAATIVGGGAGYQVGDTVGVATLGSGTNKNAGKDVKLSVVGVGMTNELILQNVQGEWGVGAGKTVYYVNGAGTAVALNNNNTPGVGVTVAAVTEVSDGLHIKVNHKNHGMYFDDNKVILSQAQSDIKPTKLAAAYDVGAVGPISVDNATSFSTFEGVGIGTTNTGYLKIEDEIIEYTSVDGSNIGGNIVRGSNKASYAAGTPVYKYELGGVNLSRINKTHTLSDVSIVTDPIGYDHYYVKLDMSTKFNVNNDDRSNNVGFKKLFLNSTKSSGGYKTRATQNMPFEIITPLIGNVTVQGTSIESQIRTITSRSLSGAEIPFIDDGFEAVALNQTNYLDSPRMIASKVNEDLKLTNIAGNKSLQLSLTLSTTDTRISPVIDGQRKSVITTSNRVNAPIKNYATDPRVNDVFGDPTACQYISKEITLENPGTSIKLLLGAHIHLNSDIRAFYSVSDKQGFKPIFVPFPGWKNLNSRGDVIDASKNDGQSDKFVTKTNSYGFESERLEFSEYVWTADKLPSFRSYRIKIVMTSNSQVYVPRMKDLRVIALA